MDLVPMSASDVDLNARHFPDHPVGWRSPNELFNAFVLNWAIEELVTNDRPRAMQIGLPGWLTAEVFKADPLGGLFHGDVTPFNSRGATAAKSRLLTLAGSYRVFDLFSQTWGPIKGNYSTFADAMSEATGGVERRSIFGGLQAVLAKGLIAARVTREYKGEPLLHVAEEFFYTGDPELLGKGDWEGCVIFFIGPSRHPVPLDRRTLYTTVWSCARVIVGMLGAENVILRNHEQLGHLLRIISAGSQLANELGPGVYSLKNAWPGWQ